jgi:hypothetical protein
MAQWYECPNCRAKGLYVFDVFRILNRSIVDPALDEVECRTCLRKYKRYDGLCEGSRNA